MDVKKGDKIPLLHHLIIGELYIANLKSVMFTTLILLASTPTLAWLIAIA
jgi:hypothetical protein